MSPQNSLRSLRAVNWLTAIHASKDLGNNDLYGNNEGTSFAAPQIAGVGALLRAMVPKMPVQIIRQRILDNVEEIEDLDPNGDHPTVTGGRLNAYNAMNNQDTTAPSAIDDLDAGASTKNSVTLDWTATGDDGSTGTATLYQVRYDTATITDDDFYIANRAGNEPDPNASGSSEEFTVTGLSPWTTYYFAVKAFDEWGNGPISNVESCTTRPAACTSSYCIAFGELYKRCTFNSTYDSCPDSCCNYTCVLDATCTAPDSVPETACQ